MPRASLIQRVTPRAITRAVVAVERSGRHSTLIRYAIAPLAVLLAAAVQTAAFPEPSIAQFVFFNAAIALTGALAGYGPGLLSALLSSLMGNRYFWPPAGVWTTTRDALTASALFFVSGVLVALICATVRSALLRVESAAGELERRGDLLRIAHDAILVYRLDGVIEFWNEGAEQLYGFSSDQAVGRVSHDLLRTVFPEPLPEVEQSLRDHHRWQGELEHRRRDGSTVVVSTKMQLVRGRDGIDRVLEATRDITAARRAERRLRAVYDLPLLGIFYCAKDGSINEANDKFLEMTGYDRADLEAGRLNWVTMTPPEWRHVDERAIRNFQMTSVIEPIEKEYIRKDGSRLPVLLGSAVLDEDRREAVAFIVDITERKRTEKALAHANAALRAVSESTPVLVALKDRDSRIVLANPALMELAGRTREEVYGHSEVDWFGPEIGGPILENDRSVMSTLTTQSIEETTPGGRTWLSTKTPWRDAEGRVLGVAVVSHEITERKAMERALQEADRRKDEFLGILSHELRNPLAPLRNSTYILRRAAPGSEQARRAQNVIERQTEHLTRLVDDLLDVTRIDRGKIRLQLERLDLRVLLERVAEDHRTVLERNAIAFQVDIGDEAVPAMADAARIAQIVGNLLQNAEKFTPPGGTVRLQLRRVGERYAEIAVRDTGEGIAPDLLPRLFEPFVQADRTLHRSVGGLGLGLALVKGLTELHQGSIRVESAGPGQGSSFVVRLPVERRVRPRLALVEEKPHPRPAPLRVLVVEDNVDAAETLKDVLELDGHQVELSYSGTDGLLRARAFKPDAIICDIGLPGLNGFQVASAIRADPELKNVGLIALSGYAQPQDMEESRAAGFDVHLAKPPSAEALAQCLAQAHAAAMARSETGAPAAMPRPLR